MYVRAGTRNRRLTLHGLIKHYDTKRCKSIPCWAAFVCVVVGGGGNLAEPDPYVVWGTSPFARERKGLVTSLYYSCASGML